jgi:hypothetical protein
MSEERPDVPQADRIEAVFRNGSVQLVSLAAMLRTDALEGWRYRRAVNQFLIGLALVSIGVAIAIVVDVIAVVGSRS